MSVHIADQPRAQCPARRSDVSLSGRFRGPRVVQLVLGNARLTESAVDRTSRSPNTLSTESQHRSFRRPKVRAECIITKATKTQETSSLFPSREFVVSLAPRRLYALWRSGCR